MSLTAPSRLRIAADFYLSGRVKLLMASAGLMAAAALSAAPAFALSEIKREELPAPSKPEITTTPQPDQVLPQPDPTDAPGEDPADETPATTQPADPESKTEPAQPETSHTAEPDEPLPEIIYDFSRLPPEVQKLRSLVLEVCKSGDIEKLRPLLGVGEDMTQLSLGGVDGDPIAYLKTLAGDPDGQEILAILEEVLSAGYVHLDAGTPEELYVWPYFFAVPIDKITGPQRVELFKIVTAGDYEEMKTYGSYIFYRVGITPQGRWAFFVAGE